MTQTPAAASVAPVPVEPGQSLDLTPKAPSAVQGAARESVQWTGQLVVAPKEHPEHGVAYELMPNLTALDMCLLQEAQDSGKFREIITAIKQLVVKHQREALVAQLLADPDDVTQRMSLEDCMDVLTNGMEQISARPTDK